MKRFCILFFSLSFLILLVFGIWGDGFETFFNQQNTETLLGNASAAAGPLGAALLVSDIFLPIPTTVVIGAMGAVLGPVAGAIWGWVGLTAAGWAGYLFAKIGGEGWKNRMITPEEEKRFARFFNQKGGFAVVVSRMLPILPEVLSMVAGFYGMSPLRFGLAVTLGSLPPAILFSWIGASAREAPLPALLVITLLTGGCWFLVLHLFKDGESTEFN